MWQFWEAISSIFFNCHVGDKLFQKNVGIQTCNFLQKNNSIDLYFHLHFKKAGFWKSGNSFKLLFFSENVSVLFPAASDANIVVKA